MKVAGCMLAAVVSSVAALTLVATVVSAQIGQEKAVPVHLQDGQEQQMPLRKLIAFGESLFVARFTTEDGLVSGPTNVGMEPPDVGSVDVPPPDYDDLELSSIQLDSSGTAPPGDSGTFASVQLVTKFNVVYYNGGDCSFSVGTGLDTQFPYSNGQTFFDAPAIPLYSNDTEATADFAATVFFMWKSSTSGSIWVPLGYVTWQWSGDAVQNSGAWSLRSGGGSASGITISSTYPQWSSYVHGIEPPCH